MKLHPLIKKEVERLLFLGKNDDALRLIMSVTNCSIEEGKTLLDTFPGSKIKNINPEEEDYYYKKDLKELEILSDKLAIERGEKLDYELKKIVHIQRNIEEDLRRSTLKVDNIVRDLIPNKGIDNYKRLIEMYDLQENAGEINNEEKNVLIKNAKEEFLQKHWNILTVSLIESQRLLELDIINEKQHSVVIERVQKESEKEENSSLILEENRLKRKKEFYVNYILGRIIAKKDNPKNNILNGNSTNTKTDCFIVTTTMGDKYHPVVIDYRKYRDDVLSKILIGRMFIRVYYEIGPFLAFVIRKNKILFKISKKIVLRLHKLIKIR